VPLNRSTAEGASRSISQVGYDVIKFNLLALTPISTLRESVATCERGTEAAAIRQGKRWACFEYDVPLGWTGMERSRHLPVATYEPSSTASG
jgi:hypothetical protein